MSSIARLKALLELEEDGEEIAAIIAGFLVDEEKKDIFRPWLNEVKSQLQMRDVEIRLTDPEEAVKSLVLEARMPVTTQDVADKLGENFPSLKYRTHTSAALNSLVSKGVLGKYKDGYSFYFTTPREAVMVRLKKRGEDTINCKPSKIAQETGMPLATVMDVLDELR